MNKQTFFESTYALENAQVMLDVCRDEYERAGLGAAVRSLKGLDVTSLDSAHVALLTVHGLPAPYGLQDIREYAIVALRDAVNAYRSTRKLAS